MDQASRKEKTRLLIEEAAMELLASKSFSSVTMEEIAAKSTFTKRTIYNYFPSKSALIASIFERKLVELYQIEEDALKHCNSSLETICTHFRTLTGFSEENYSFMKMLWALKNTLNMDEIPQESLDHIIEANRKVIEMEVSYVSRFPLTGFLANYSPEMIIHYISAVNKGIFLQHDKENSLSIKGPSRRDLTDFAFDCLLYGLRD